MAKLNIVDIKAANVGSYDFNDKLLLAKPANQALFDVVIAEKNAQRQGTHSTLTKAEVRGGGRKPVPQKHTGNARQGSIRNPHYVGGGVVFGPKPNRNYKNGVNKKVNTLAMLTALTQKVKANDVVVLANDVKGKTKDFAAMLKALKFTGMRVLFIFNDKEIACVKKCANIAKVDAKGANQVSVYDLMVAKKIVIQAGAMDQLAKRLGGK